MKKNLLSLAMSLALLMSAAAHAQTTRMNVNVPFDFTVRGVTLPAGEYEVKADGPWGGPVLSIHNVHSNAGSLFTSISCRSQKPAVDSKLVFRHYGQRYFLAEVWSANNFTGRQVKIDPRQKELARNQPKEEVTLIASKR